MSLTHRPTEIKELVKLLDSEHDDVEALAKAVLDLLVEIKWNRGGWVTLVNHGPLITAYGPYQTANAANRDFTKRLVGSSPGCRGLVLRVRDLDAEPERSPVQRDQGRA